MKNSTIAYWALNALALAFAVYMTTALFFLKWSASTGYYWGF